MSRHPRAANSFRQIASRSRGTTVIARTWHGATLTAKADAYFEYLRETGIPGYRSSVGNRGVYVLREDRDGRTDFLLVSLWDSFAAIRKFAGPDYERAVYYPRDKEFLLEMEPNVHHYEVLLSPNSTSGSRPAGPRRSAVR